MTKSSASVSDGDSLSDIAWQDELYDHMNWPDFEDYSIFDLVLHTTQDVRTKLRSHRQKVFQKLNSNIKLLEKLAFIFGVTCVWSGAFIMGKYPYFFAHWYTVLAFALFTIRWFSYKNINWHYFCFDLCYFVNFLILVWLWILPRDKGLYFAVFSLANGPISWAILAWRNSMVFHSLDKVITVFIHLAPPLLMFNLRWFCQADVPEEDYYFLPVSYVKFQHLTHGTNPLGGNNEMSYFESLFYALSFYMIWQVLYFLGIVMLKGTKVDQGLRMTSYSWLLDPKKNEARPSLMYKLCSLSVFGASNNVMFRIFLFMFWQWMYALVSISPVVLFYKYFYLNLAYVLFLLTISIWNGACYYLEVFSNAIKKQKEHLNEHHHK